MITLTKLELERIVANIEEYSRLLEKLNSFFEETPGAPIPCLKLSQADNASTFHFNAALADFVLGVSSIDIPTGPPISISFVTTQAAPSILANNPFGTPPASSLESSNPVNSNSVVSTDQSSVFSFDDSLGTHSSERQTDISGDTRINNIATRPKRPPSLSTIERITRAFDQLKNNGNLSYSQNFNSIITSANHPFNIYSQGGKTSPETKWRTISVRIIGDEVQRNGSNPAAINYFSFFVQTERFLALNTRFRDRTALFRTYGFREKNELKSLNDAYLFGSRISKFASECGEGEDNVKLCGLPLPWTLIYTSAHGWKHWSTAYNSLNLRQTYRDQFD